MKFQKPRGTHDLLPQEAAHWQWLERTARDVCERFRYREIRTPIFESTGLFERGVGETTDIVEKEMYTFIDKGERSMTLRPEGTAGVVRAYVENKLYAEPDVQKLFYTGPMFRYERAMAGRNRQFHQFGVEAFGSLDPALDAEVIALGYQIYQALGLKDVRVELNSVGTPACRANYREALQAFFAPKLSAMCADCNARFHRNPMRLLDCKVDTEACNGAPSIIDYLDEPAKRHFDAVQQDLHAMEIPFTVNPSLVRGLDYYTHTAFEYMADGIGTITTIGGGGRFNGLVGEIGGPDQPGVGFGLGMERALLIAHAQGVVPPSEPPLDVFVAPMGATAERVSVGWVQRLRQAGLRVERDYQGRKLKALFKAAERQNARWIAILGDDEVANEQVTLKQLASGEQKTVPWSAWLETIQSN
jgi:histidyl-tRNA synthetase